MLEFEIDGPGCVVHAEPHVGTRRVALSNGLLKEIAEPVPGGVHEDHQAPVHMNTSFICIYRH